MERTSENKLLQIALSLALAFVIFLVYRGILSHGISEFDDNAVLTNNEAIHGGFSVASVKWAFTTGHFANWMPITWLSHILDMQLYGLEQPGGHHATNLILHILACWVLFAALRRLTGSLWRSFFVTCLFALHPMHVESVAWIAERKGILSTFFWTLTLWCYARYRERPTIGGYLFVVMSFILGLMSKQMLVTLPIVLLILDDWPLRKLSQYFPQCVIEKVPLFVLTMIFAVIAYLAQKHGGAVGDLSDAPIGPRMKNVLCNYLIYLRKCFWPSDLCIYYPHPEDRISSVAAALSGLALLALTFFFVIKGRTQPYLRAGWLWYCITLLPVSGIVPVGRHGMADRYSDIPLLGIYIMVVWTFCDFAQRQLILKPFLIAAATGILAMLCFVSHKQCGYFETDEKLFKRALEVSPKDPRDGKEYNDMAHTHLGIWAFRHDDYATAAAHFLRATEIVPDYPHAYFRLSGTLLAMNDLAGAEENAYKSLKIDPNCSGAMRAVGTILSTKGKFQEAYPYLVKAIELDPADYPGVTVLANVEMRLRKYEAAEQHLQEYLQRFPNDFGAIVQLTQLYKVSHQFNKALESCQQLLNINPQIYIAHHIMAEVLIASGHPQEGIQHLRTAMRLAPQQLTVQQSLILVLSSHPDPNVRNAAEALELAQKLPRSTPDANAFSVELIGSAYAGLGQFDKAIECCRETLEFLKSINDVRAIKIVEAKIKLYEARQLWPYMPFTEEPPPQEPAKDQGGAMTPKPKS